MNSRGIAAHWQEQTAAGGVRRVLDIEAATGLLNARTQSGTLNAARGVLYQNDEPRARFEAPTVRADRERDTVTALGGVTVRSVEPPGAVVTADRVIWHARTNEVVAEGNVQMTYQPPGATMPAAFGHAPRITFNTELDRYRIP